ncbi:MAG: ATP-binding cassette domain-containing protein, partial [Spirochaetaceae bacterium]|nr:ATP-binding cassette domain-containing protein [Spirochaetaceae bacterium]
MAGAPQRLLTVEGLKKHFPIEKGLFRRTVGHVRAVDGVSLAVRKGETLGLVGESGCGKTTTGRMIAGLYEPTAGRVVFHADGQDMDVWRLTQVELLEFRRGVQIVFQDPFSSLNPWMRVTEIIGEPLIVQRGMKGRELRREVGRLLEVVGLSSQLADRFPHQAIGGTIQGTGIPHARASVTAH